MIKFEWRPKPEWLNGPTIGLMYVDDKPINADVQRSSDGVSLDLWDADFASVILGLSFFDFPQNEYKLTRPRGAFEWWDGTLMISFVRGSDVRSLLDLEVRLYPVLAEWNKSWSFATYRNELMRVHRESQSDVELVLDRTQEELI